MWNKCYYIFGINFIVTVKYILFHLWHKCTTCYFVVYVTLYYLLVVIYLLQIETLHPCCTSRNFLYKDYYFYSGMKEQALWFFKRCGNIFLISYSSIIKKKRIVHLGLFNLYVYSDLPLCYWHVFQCWWMWLSFVEMQVNRSKLSTHNRYN